MINPRKYGTTAEVAAKTGIGRTTLVEAVKRADPPLQIVTTVGGTKLVSVVSVRKWLRNRPPRGPKPKGK